MFNVVGIRNLDYFSKKSSKQVVGKELHLVSINQRNKDILGERVLTIYLSENDLLKLPLPDVGCTLDIHFNERGQLEYYDIL